MDTSLWRHADFMKLWSGQTVSVFGSLITRVAIGFTAILYLHASTLQVSLLAASDILPGFLFGLIAGVWVDRLRRRPVMIAADLGRALVLGSIPLAALFGALHIGQLFAVALLASALTVCFDVAYLSYLPTLVPPDRLIDGNSKLAASQSVAEVGSFGIAGWLVQVFSGPAAIFIDALTFVWSAGSLALIRTPEPPPPPTEGRTSVRTEAVEGMRAIMDHPGLRALLISALVLYVSMGAVGAVILLFVTRSLDFQPAVLGMIFAVGGLTSLAGATVAGTAARRLGAHGAIVAGLVLTGIGGVFVPLARGATVVGAVLLIAGQCVTDPGATIAEINAISLRQSLAPAALLGRVNASMQVAKLGALLLGSLAGGLAGAAFGLRAVLFSSAIGCALAAVPVLLARPGAISEPVAVSAGATGDE